MKLWSRLQKGETLEEGGRVFTPDMVLGRSRRGLHVTYATDTRPCEIIATMASGADLLICEGMFEAEKAARAREAAHMTMIVAARLAAAAECRELWLTHFSPALPNPEDYIHEPRGVFKNTTIAFDGLSKSLNFDDE